jgi:hypothetical protein
VDGPGIDSRWGGRDFPHAQTSPGAHPASCTMGTRSFPGVKCGRGVLLTTHPLLAPRLWKSRAIAVPPSGSQPFNRIEIDSTDVHESVHRNTIMKSTNKMQIYRIIYYSKSVLHVSSVVFVHHQEHLTVFTVSRSVHPKRCSI